VVVSEAGQASWRAVPLSSAKEEEGRAEERREQRFHGRKRAGLSQFNLRSKHKFEGASENSELTVCQRLIDNNRCLHAQKLEETHHCKNLPAKIIKTNTFSFHEKC